jgi:hypothetical protein
MWSFISLVASLIFYPDVLQLLTPICSSQHINMSNINLSISIDKGEPLDWQMYRHTALCLRPTDGEKPMIVHAAGPKGEYVLETKDDYDPATSPMLAKEVHVASTRVPASKIQVAAILHQTPVRNRDPEFDCQKWVGDALQKLVEAGCIEQEECERGIEGMVEVIMEAEDEGEE